MSNWNPLLGRGDTKNPEELTNFIKGMSGAYSTNKNSQILLAILAGYVGGRIAQRTGQKK